MAVQQNIVFRLILLMQSEAIQEILLWSDSICASCLDPIFRRIRTLQLKRRACFWLCKISKQFSGPKEYQRNIMSRNFDLNNKPIYCKRDVLRGFEANCLAHACNYAQLRHLTWGL